MFTFTKNHVFISRSFVPKWSEQYEKLLFVSEVKQILKVWNSFFKSYGVPYALRCISPTSNTLRVLYITLTCMQEPSRFSSIHWHRNRYSMPFSISAHLLVRIACDAHVRHIKTTWRNTQANLLRLASLLAFLQNALPRRLVSTYPLEFGDHFADIFDYEFAFVDQLGGADTASLTGCLKNETSGNGCWSPQDTQLMLR